MVKAVTQWGQTRILWFMAAEVEYGPCLQRLFVPVFTGVGPVEAAVASTRVLTELAFEKALPDLVVSLGSAGSRTLQQTEVYQASSVSWRDIDASAFGVPRGQIPYLDLPAELPLPLYLSDLSAERMSTGANVVGVDDYAAIDAEMVEMESYAILRACQQFDVPLWCLRGISDGASRLEGIEDWTQYLHVVDQNLAAVCERLKVRAEETQGVLRPIDQKPAGVG